MKFIKLNNVLNERAFSSKKTLACLIFILLVTSCFFSSSLNNGFTNWDDDVYLLENPLVRSLTLENIGRIFSSYVSGSYHPLTTLTYALEYNFFGLKPYYFHFDNLLLHLFNVGLVFILILLLSENLLVCSFVALLFGIHPMHVESVAWITERKDLLYAFFYLSGLVMYIFYLKKTKHSSTFFLSTFIFFLLSILSKPAAVTFPFAILLLDYFFKRPLSRKIFFEKIPFALIAISFGIVAVLGAGLSEAIDGNSVYSLFDRILIANYSIVVYVIKLVFPYKLSCVYPLPDQVSGVFYGMFVFSIILMLFSIVRPLKNKYLIFGAAFFFVTVFPTLQFFMVGIGFLSDRFTYIPSIGIFFALAVIVNNYMSRPNIKIIKVVFYLVLVFYSLFLGLSSFNRNKVWQNSLTLWSDAIEKYPQVALSYNNRGNVYAFNNQYEIALEDYNKAIELKPLYVEAYGNRALVLIKMGLEKQALLDFNKALHMRVNVKILNNRGNFFRKKGQFDLAVKDYDLAINKNPKAFKVYNNRGVTYYMMKKYDLALNDFNKAINLSSDYAEAYNSRAVVFSARGTFDRAVSDFDRAIKLNPKNGSYYYNRGVIFYRLKKLDKALNDYMKAEQLGYKFDHSRIENLISQINNKN